MKILYFEIHDEILLAPGLRLDTSFLLKRNYKAREHRSMDDERSCAIRKY